MNPRILLGTCSWTADGWKGAFYPPATSTDDYLGYYARHFPTVEIDSTFYRIPSPSTVANWAERTPPHFVFAAKVPRIVTHEKILEGAEPDLLEFCRAMEPLGSRMGPLLLQFPYFSREKFSDPEEFLARLRAFLPVLPPDFQWALEIRNRTWIGDALLDLLESHRVALALIDHPWMPTAREYAGLGRILTARFSYVRWLGDRDKIEELTSAWDRTIVDRTTELQRWVDLLKDVLPSVDRIYGYANNHYAGFSPETIRHFDALWGGGLLTPPPPEEPAGQLSLF